MAVTTLVNATDLNRWADTRDAQEMLARLVRRLAEQTNPSIRRLQFAADESVQLPGYDGTIIAETASTYVPDGISAWELGTSKQVTTKANFDYKKRTKSPGDVNPAKSTFVFVTPRRWSRKGAWCRSKQSERRWQEVRAFDADDLAQWLERVPAVHYWISIRLGKHPEGAEDVEQFCNSWSNSTNPPLNPRFVIAGRDDIATKIAEGIRSRTASLAVRAETAREALGVIAASILSLPPDDLSAALGRTLVVHNEESFRELARSPDSLLLIPTFNATEIGRAIGGGHQVIQAIEGEYGANATSLVVPRLDAEAAAKLLVESGIAEERSRELAALARRGFSAFHRKIAVRPEMQRPGWAAPSNASPLIPALLLGSWRASKEGDRDALEAIAGTSYESATDMIRRWLHESDSPIRQVGDVWFVAAKEDAWLLLAPYVTSTRLERFRTLAVSLLTTRDPKFDLPDEKQWTAALYGAVAAHSNEIKKGVAETVAILGGRNDLVPHASGATGTDFAAAIVRDVLEVAGSDWRVWATLSPVLPLLAEAAPAEFLSAVEKGITGDDPVLLRLFRKDPADVPSSTPHTGLLWSLETIAWSPDYLVRAAVALGRLAEIDPGGKMANRPYASLRKIFLPWSPQTSASPERCLKAIDLVRKRTPGEAWKLLLSLLPRPFDASDFNPKPEWRSWAPVAEVKPTLADLARRAHEITARLLEDAGSLTERWRQLVSAAESLPPGDRREVLSRLGAMGAERFSDADSAQIWNDLRDIVARHRSFRDARWARHEDVISEFANLLPVFEPEDPVLRSAWLFTHAPHLTNPPNQNFDDQREAANALRAETLKELFLTGGLDAIADLARIAKVPIEVGATAAALELPGTVVRTLIRQYLNCADQAASACAHGFVSASIARNGVDWALARLTDEPQISVGQLASILSYLEPCSETFDVVEKQTDDVQTAYWKVMFPYRVESHDVDYVANKLLTHKRPYTALDLLGMQRTFNRSLTAETAAQVLERIAKGDAEDEAPSELSGHNIGEMLDAIADGTLPIERLARIEFAFLLSIGRFIRSPKVLQRLLAENPRFFVDVLSIAFRGEGEGKAEISEREAARARAAYELLDIWSVVPGTTAVASVNREVLKLWLGDARAMAATVNRKKIADTVIGQMLAHADPEGDVWPPPAVCEALEEVASEEMDLGFSDGVARSRGAVWRSLDEGGKQEHGLAEHYRGLANTVNDDWPRAAALLREIAADYDRQGRRWDDETRLRQDL